MIVNYEEVRPLLNNFQTSFPILYRSRVDKDRFYYAYIDGEFVRFPSVTTIIADTIPADEWLIRWISAWGYEKAIEKREQAAAYGTLFAMTAAEFLKNGFIDLSTIELRIETFRLANNLQFSTEGWADKLKEDLYSLACFAKDYNFEPLAVEMPLCSKTHRFAGTIDAIGFLTIGSGVNGKILKNDIEKGKTKRVFAIIDWKTGRKGFYRSHAAQLHFYKILVEENLSRLKERYPDVYLFNWAPKEWIDEEDAKYTLKDQTDSDERDKVFHYLAIYELGQKNEEPKTKIFNGVLQLNQDNSNILRVVEYREALKEQLTQNIFDINDNK